MSCRTLASAAFLLASGLAPIAFGQTDSGEDAKSPDSVDAAPQEVAPAPSEAAPIDSSGNKTLRFGPHVAIGIPHPLTAGVDIIYADSFGISFSAGRAGTEIDDTEIEIRNWDVGARWFPFGGSFFIGALYGSQGLVGKRKVDLDVDAGGTSLTVPTTLRLSIDSRYFTPHIGWYARWDSGFSLGFDIGVQLPSSSNSDLQTAFANVSQASEASVRNSEEYKKNKKDVEDIAEALGEKAIPYINLIKLGWMF